MSTVTDFTQSPDEILLALIKDTNASTPITQTLTGGEYTSANPVVVVDGTETDPVWMNRKSKMTLTALQGSGYKDTVDIMYSRIHWRDVMLSTDPLTTEFAITTTPLTVNTETQLSDLIPAINTEFGLNVQAEDYVDLALPPFTGDAVTGTTVRFAADPTSKIFVGGVLLSIKPATIDLMDAIPMNVLSGLTYTPNTSDIGTRLHSLLTTMSQPGYW